ncbi:acyl-[acyl-carrier-protein] thioesterase [Nocardia sp. NPDC050175]|uniref:acyl-[acyl-carrier-protein] thioesterase n=1 Tax=Nocardia sp. NPDC050175 TaxID=3364317 RepID=UPI003794C97B
MGTEIGRIAAPLPPCPDGHAAFEASWPVRLADTDIEQRLRLDAIARYAMDLGYEHLQAVDDGDLHPAWLVSRTVIDVLRPIEFGDRVHLRRWPSALSNRWFTARIQIRSEQRGLAEVEQFLINVDPVAGRPARMTDRFMASMLTSTTDHRLRWRPALQQITDTTSAPTSFQLRVADFDRYGHVNNAVHWQAVEEGLAHHPTAHTTPYRAIVEHVGAIAVGDEVMLRTQRTDDALHLQIEVDGTARTLAQVTRLDRPRQD